MSTPQPVHTTEETLSIDIPCWLCVTASADHATVRRSTLVRDSDPMMKPVNDYIRSHSLGAVEESVEPDPSMMFGEARRTEYARRRLRPV